MLLEGSKALVSGAGRGIGTAIARLLAAEGASVALAYRSPVSGVTAHREVALIQERGGIAIALQADLGIEAECERLVAQTCDAQEGLGGLDVLVNNAAGFGPLGLLADADWARIDDEWQSVVRPVINLTHAALPHLIAQGQGRIVNLAATLVDRPAARYGAHTMAKAAVLAYTRTLAREVGPRGIRVNAVSPGMTLTDFSQSLPDDVKESVAHQTPLRRLALPDDVARAVVYLCSPLSEFVTGANIAPDGGLAIL